MNLKNIKNNLLLIVCLIIFGVISFSRTTSALTNINSTDKWAWNNFTGWINFYSAGNVNVRETYIDGYADSPMGAIALNCATTPNGNICSGPAGNWGVTNTNGILSGWAWNDAVGWISFNCNNTGIGNTCGTINYKVTITDNIFSGWAWNDAVGWISFNCSDISGLCVTSNYKTKTNFSGSGLIASLTSSIFDTQIVDGAAINSIMWQGTQPTGTSVNFQIASANSIEGGGAGAISYLHRYAWNDLAGWIDFATGNINVGENQLTGYAYNSDIGEIALDCATSPSGDICNSSNFKISHNSTTGDLSGWAWNDAVGWISFNCSDPGLCATSNYKVNINPTTGQFSGWAWNDAVGWISFNCSNTNTCSSSNYYVKTDLSLGSWSYIGPDGTANSYYYSSGPNIPIEINLAHHNNKRYIRYKIFLESDANFLLTPEVTNVIINWSP